MNTVILDEIPFSLDMLQLFRRLRLKENSEYGERVRELTSQAVRIARPKALYGKFDVEAVGEELIRAGGVTFTSSILREKLKESEAIFPYIATCGREVAQWANSFNDFFDDFIADVIQDMVRITAADAVFRAIDETHKLIHASNMNPGSLPNWPLSQQRQLFDLFGGLTSQIGVELSDSLLMAPVKSVSGIRFGAVERFVNCQLCQKKQCPNRKVPYGAQVV